MLYGFTVAKCRPICSILYVTVCQHTEVCLTMNNYICEQFHSLKSKLWIKCNVYACVYVVLCDDLCVCLCVCVCVCVNECGHRGRVTRGVPLNSPGVLLFTKHTHCEGQSVRLKLSEL